MASKYPRIGGTRRREKNTCAKCRCGATGKYLVDVEVSYMRGDDEVLWACAAHKSDAHYLLGHQK